MITSYSNKSVREVIQLTQKAKARNKPGVFVVEGIKMFSEAPVERIERVYIAQRAEKELWETYRDKLNRLSCETVADDVFDKMSDTKTPQGILTLVRQYHYRLEDASTELLARVSASSAVCIRRMLCIFSWRIYRIRGIWGQSFGQRRLWERTAF